MFSSKKLVAALLSLLLCFPVSAQVLVTGAGNAGANGPSTTPTHQACINTSGTVTTFTASNFGPANSGRVTVVSVNWADTTAAGTAELTSVTVGGVAMARAIRAVGDNQNSNSEIWYILNPTGTSGNIVVTSSTVIDAVTISVYSLLGYGTPTVTGTGTTTASNAYTNKTVSLAAGSRRVNVSTSLSNMTNNYSTNCGTGLWGVHAYNGNNGNGTLTTTINPTSNTPLIAMATWSACPQGVCAFTPLSLGTNIRAWYQANLLSGSTGDPQSLLPDSSGNGFDLSQTLALRPTLQVADLNSLNTLRFTASANQRYALSVSILSGSTSGSAYYVQKIISNSVANGIPQWGTGGLQTYAPFSDGNIYDDFGSTVRKTVGASTGILTSYRIFSVYSATNDWAFFVDGGTGGSGGGTSPLGNGGVPFNPNTVAWAGAGTTLGANASATPLDGWYGEAIYTNVKQSTVDRQKMEGYLACKWALQGNLSASHPYKSACPTQ